MPSGTRAYGARLRWQLLVSCSNGRFVRPVCAWIRPCTRPGWYWLDADALTAHAETLTGSERRMLLLAAALVGGDPWTRRRFEESRRPIDSGRAAA